MRSWLGRLLRRSAFYRRLRTAQAAGWAFSLRRWRIERQILPTRPIRTRAVGAPGTPCEVRMQVYEPVSLMALWAAKSFYVRAGVDWPLIWLQGGWMSDSAIGRLREHFPDSRFVSLKDADAAVETELDRLGLTATISVRRIAFPLRRPIDFRISGASDRAFFLDADVLFFQRPTDLLDAVTSRRRVNLFNKDATNGYGLTVDEAEGRFGVRPMERLNAGLCLVCRESLGLDETECYLAEPEMMANQFVDQLVYGLLAASFPTEHLPETYRISADPGLTVHGTPLVARHYAGRTRPLMFTEGMPALVERGFLQELGRP
jgi:hypothetical protein